MKSIYIILCRSGTLLSRIVYRMTGDPYTHVSLAGFNIFGLLLCRLNIRLQRRRHFFCSQFVAQVLEDSRSLHLPKDRTLMRPGDYARLRKLRCVYKGTLQELRRRQGMEVTPPVSCTAIYMQLLWTAARRRWAGMAGSR